MRRFVGRPLVGKVGSLAWAFDGSTVTIRHYDPHARERRYEPPRPAKAALLVAAAALSGCLVTHVEGEPEGLELGEAFACTMTTTNGRVVEVDGCAVDREAMIELLAAQCPACSVVCESLVAPCIPREVSTP